MCCGELCVLCCSQAYDLTPSLSQQVCALQVVTTYLQTNGIIAGLNINWPNSLRSIQNLFNVVQSSMVNTVSMDCSLQYWDTPVLSQAGFEALLAMLIPVGMLTIFCIGWACR